MSHFINTEANLFNEHPLIKSLEPLDSNVLDLIAWIHFIFEAIFQFETCQFHVVRSWPKTSPKHPKVGRRVAFFSRVVRPSTFDFLNFANRPQTSFQSTFDFTPNPSVVFHCFQIVGRICSTPYQIFRRHMRCSSNGLIGYHIWFNI